MKKGKTAALIFTAFMTIWTSGTIASGGGMIDCAREYVFPAIDVPVLCVEENNYHTSIPVIDYSVFDAEDFIGKLSAEVAYEERDNNNDGIRDQLLGRGNTVQWGLVDNNYDSVYDYAVLLEANYNSYIDFKMEWCDYDYNGTMDEVKIHITNYEDINSGQFSTQYVYGDFSDINFDEGTADYTNKNKVQYIQAVTLPENNSLGEQQIFRDMDGDGGIDWMQVRRYYDINEDNVKESTKILNDRDMDGIFEEEFVYDGTVFDESVDIDF